MDSTQASIESGISKYVQLIRADKRLASEFELSRRTFFGSDPVEPSPQSDRRHLEWFLLERPSAILEGVPSVLLREAWLAKLGAQAQELADAFQNSFAGAFELSTLVVSEGIWVRDLFGLGEYPVLESEATPELEPGDLLVGRLFPVSGGEFALSPAACCFRNPLLLDAVRKDLEHMRQARRGVLRVQQIELERLFFRPSPGSESRSSSRESVREQVREALKTALPEAEVEKTLADLGHAARRGESLGVTEILNRLAFETPLDLSRTHKALAEFWASERVAGEQTDRHEEATRDPRAALEAFDRGRAEGRELEVLFRKLEQDLGVSDEDEESGAANEGAPDLPGLVGALVEEFLWDIEREKGADAALKAAVLRRLGHYGREIGLLEELGSRQLLDFAGRWLLDEGQLSDPEEAHRILSALGTFCRWCEECHAHPLWREFSTTLQVLRRSVPRLLLCRQHDATPRARELPGAYRILRLEQAQAVLEDLGGSEQTVSLTALQRIHLRPGDLVRLVECAGQRLPGKVYPAELIDLLR